MAATEERYICLLTGFGFKRIFGAAPNKDLLTNFLNSLFEEAEIASFPVSSYFPYAVSGESASSVSKVCFLHALTGKPTPSWTFPYMERKARVGREDSANQYYTS